MPAKRKRQHDGAAADADATQETGAQRLDRWLWFTRTTKSRSLAAGLIADGKVRINKVRVTKPSQLVKIDDVVTIAVHRQVRVLKMIDPGKRRGPASEALTLYEDLTPEPEPDGNVVSPASAGADPRAIPAPQAQAPAREPGSGRPTKRERRSLDRLRRDGSTDA